VNSTGPTQKLIEISLQGFDEVDLELLAKSQNNLIYKKPLVNPTY
jgi:hypothetical protein